MDNSITIETTISRGKDGLKRVRKQYAQWRNHSKESKIYICVLFALANGKCPVCKCDMVLHFGFDSTKYPNLATLDHITPLSKILEHSKYGLQIMCRTCNTRKSSKIEMTVNDDMRNRAKRFAEKAHFGVLDDAGYPYINHLVQTVKILERVTNDEEIISAGWLHDIIEDTKYTYEDIKHSFGKRVADLVSEVTHEGDRTSGYIFPRLKSREAILIKFADRLSNLSRMETWSEERIEHYLKRSKFWK